MHNGVWCACCHISRTYTMVRIPPAIASYSPTSQIVCTYMRFCLFAVSGTARRTNDRSPLSPLTRDDARRDDSLSAMMWASFRE